MLLQCMNNIQLTGNIQVISWTWKYFQLVFYYCGNLFLVTSYFNRGPQLVTIRYLIHYHSCFFWTSPTPPAPTKAKVQPCTLIMFFSIYMSRSQFGRVCRRGVIFETIRYWFSNTHFKASYWFQKQYPGV